MNQEDLSGNPNMQLGGLLAPWPSDDGVQIVEEVLSYRVEGGSVLLECWTSGGEWATVVLTPVDEYVVRLTLYPSGGAAGAARDAVPGRRIPPTRQPPPPRRETGPSGRGSHLRSSDHVDERDGVVSDLVRRPAV